MGKKDDKVPSGDHGSSEKQDRPSAHWSEEKGIQPEQAKDALVPPPGQDSTQPPEGAQPKEELKRLKDQMMRLQADFENARKRWMKQQLEIQEQIHAELLRQLLDICDDFERALQIPSDAPDASGTFRKGVEMIAKRLEDFLKSYGVEPMDVIGQPFDPSRHEAVTHEVTEEVPESTVIGQLRKGYWMNGRVLRPAAVKVSVKSGLSSH